MASRARMRSASKWCWPTAACCNNLNKLKKDNTGYDLKNLFIGAEGTLGIITAAVLRLVPRPRSVELAFLGVPSVQAAVDLLGLAYARAGSQVTSFELMTRMNVDLAVRFIDGIRDPLDAPHPWYVLLELSSQAESGLRDLVEAIFEAGVERGLIDDGAIAQTLEQAQAFWRIREEAGEVQKHEGGSIKHDISIPVAAIPAFIDEANAAAIAVVPGARPMPFGHVGDGNIHYNITQPAGMDKAAFMAREDDIQDAVFAIVAKYGGSISAEHGIGIAKRDAAAAGEGSCGDRTDAHAEGDARSERDSQSGEGVVDRRPYGRPRTVRRTMVLPYPLRGWSPARAPMSSAAGR